MRPSRDKVIMSIAEAVSSRSTCSRLRVGSVITRDGRVLSTGYNGAPAGLPHCNHNQDETAGCVNAVHAEVNAIAYAAQWGVTTGGADLFTTHLPCLPCSQLIINAGIVRVVYTTNYRDQAGCNLLVAAGMIVDRLI